MFKESLVPFSKDETKEKPDKKESPAERFNNAVVEKMEEEFTETHDVCRQYFTHAFPFVNIEGIVNTGGLITPNELRRRGVEFTTGSDQSAGGTIFFGRDEVQSGYGTHKGIGGPRKTEKTVSAAIFVPMQEFHRTARTGRHLHGDKVMDKDEYLDEKYGGKIGIKEFPLTTESMHNESAKSDTENTARKIANQILAQKIQEAEKEAANEMARIEAAFNAEVEKLNISSTDLGKFNSDTRALFYEIQDLDYDASGERKRLKEALAKATHDQEGRTEFFPRNQAILREKEQKLAPGFLTRIVERIGIKTERQKRLSDIRRMMKKNEELQSSDQAQVDEIKKDIEALEQRRRSLDCLYKLIEENRIKKNGAARVAQEKTEDLKYHYSDQRGPTGDWDENRGAGYRKIREELMRGTNQELHERPVKVKLDHSIMVIARHGIADALKATEKKTGLRTRILVMDPKIVEHIRDLAINDKIPRSETVLIDRPLDGLNATLRYLTQTEEGFEILKAAQTGKTTKSGSAMVYSLQDYLDHQQEQKEAA